jgi:hypothetical protein
MYIVFPRCRRYFLATLLAASSCLVVPPVGAGTLQIDIAPERVWRAVRANLSSKPQSYSEVDDDRFEVRLAVDSQDVRLAVDWDEASGGSLLTWSAGSADGEAVGRGFAEKAAGDARLLRPENLYCRRGGDEDLREGFLDIVPGEAPDCGLGKFAAALFELEKCADHETALKILAACVRERNSLGILRLSQYFENGYAVPKKPERMTAYLRLAADAGTPGYSVKAKVQYATALYFGVGIAADRQAALKMFGQLASRGDSDARQFIAHGYHFAWRKPDGSVYRDPQFVAGSASR